MWRVYECFFYSPIQNYSWIEVQLIGLPRRIWILTMFYGEIQISKWRVSLHNAVKLSNLILHSSIIYIFTILIECGERLSSLCVLQLSNFNGENVSWVVQLSNFDVSPLCEVWLSNLNLKSVAYLMCGWLCFPCLSIYKNCMWRVSAPYVYFYCFI